MRMRHILACDGPQCTASSTDQSRRRQYVNIVCEMKDERRRGSLAEPWTINTLKRYAFHHRPAGPLMNCAVCGRIHGQPGADWWNVAQCHASLAATQDRRVRAAHFVICICLSFASFSRRIALPQTLVRQSIRFLSSNTCNLYFHMQRLSVLHCDWHTEKT